jgi:hypothetical protein
MMGFILVTAIPAVQSAFAFDLATFAMRIGGPGKDDVWRSIEPRSKGGYIIAGSTDSFGAGKNDGWIIKLSEDGQIESQKTYGGKGGDSLRMVRQTSDGGYVVAGMTNSFSNGRSDVWVMKFDSNGNMQWNKGYGSSNHEMAHAIEPTSDGGYLVGGYTTSFGAQLKDYFVLKIRSDGSLEWAKRFGGSGDDVIRVVKQISNGDYLIAGFTHSFGVRGDIMILRLEADGDILWQKRYGGNKFEEPSTILEVPGGYIIMEQSSSFSNTDGWLFKIDGAGGIVWQKRFGGTGFDEISAAELTSDGGFLVAAETKSFGAVNEDFWVIKFNSEGVAQWQKRYGGAGIDEPEAITLTPEGGSFVVGTTRSFDSVGMDVWFLRLDADGDIQQCASGVTAGVETDAKERATSAVPANVSTSSVAVSPSVRTGNMLAGTETMVNISFQCGVDIFNIPPVANGDSYMTNEDVPLAVSAPGVLENDTDLEDDTLNAISVTGPMHGTVELGDDGRFTYTPEGNYNGPDSFTYRANDGDNSNDSVVMITVNAVNDAPLAVDDARSTDEDNPIRIANSSLTSNDFDVEDSVLSIQSFDAISIQGGTIIVDNGDLLYEPPADFDGLDSFEYVVTDGELTDIALVNVTVGAVDDPPIATNDSYSVGEDDVLEINAATGMLANDLDENLSALTINIEDGPFSGSLVFEDDGSFIYTPADNFSGTDSFTYQLNDGNSNSNIVNVTIAVEPINDDPIGTSDSYAVEVNGTLNVDSPGVLGNDADPDGDALTAQTLTGPNSGTLELNPDGSFEYKPNDGFEGQDTFTYTLKDGFGGNASVDVFITVGTPPVP